MNAFLDRNIHIISLFVWVGGMTWNNMIYGVQQEKKRTSGINSAFKFFMSSQEHADKGNNVFYTELMHLYVSVIAFFE